MTALGDAALTYAQRGWRVFPLHGIVNRMCTCGQRTCSSPGKHPLVRRGLHDATTDELRVSDWWRVWRSANIGIATGAESGIVVIDIDLPAALDSIGRVVAAGLPRTLTVLTGGGGIHLVFASRDTELGNSAGRLPGMAGDLPGIDLRGNGGYIVAPPSLHRHGSRYQWLDAGMAVAPAPEWLKRPARIYVPPAPVVPADFEGDGSPYGLAVLRDEMDRLRASRVGTRNHQLNRSAFALAQLVAGGEVLDPAVRSSLLVVALDIGLDEREARLTIDSAFAAGLRLPRCSPHRLKS